MEISQARTPGSQPELQLAHCSLQLLADLWLASFRGFLPLWWGITLPKCFLLDSKWHAQVCESYTHHQKGHWEKGMPRHGGNLPGHFHLHFMFLLLFPPAFELCWEHRSISCKLRVILAVVTSMYLSDFILDLDRIFPPVALNDRLFQYFTCMT